LLQIKTFQFLAAFVPIYFLSYSVFKEKRTELNPPKDFFVAIIFYK